MVGEDKKKFKTVLVESWKFFETIFQKKSDQNGELTLLTEACTQNVHIIS
jgi:hypothetical protein